MLIRVKAFPGANKEEIVKKSENSFEVWVKEKPIKGQANRAIIRILSDYLKIDQLRIRLIKGFRQRNKVFEI